MLNRRIRWKGATYVQEAAHENQGKVSERNSHKPRYWGTSIELGKAQIVDTGLSRAAYNLRFLWRFAREAFFRLCLLILALRRFFNDPIFVSVSFFVKA